MRFYKNRVFKHGKLFFLPFLILILSANNSHLNAQNMEVRAIGGAGLYTPDHNFDLEDAFAVQGGLGFGFDFTDNLSANIDIMYQSYARNRDFSIRDYIGEDADEFDDATVQILETFLRATMLTETAPAYLQPHIYVKWTAPIREIIIPYDFRAKWHYHVLLGGYFGFDLNHANLMESSDVFIRMDDIEDNLGPEYGDAMFMNYLTSPMYRRIDFGLVSGIGISYDFSRTYRLSLEIRNTFGMYNTATSALDDVPAPLAEAYAPLITDMPSYQAYNRVTIASLKHHIRF